MVREEKMHHGYSVALGASLAIFAIGGASARDVKISGTHNVSDIEMHCIDNGGTFFNGPKGGYGCAGSGGGTVTCTAKGKCTGTVSAKAGPASGIGGVVKSHPVAGAAQTTSDTSNNGNKSTNLGAINKSSGGSKHK
jgi:hypothetical protein